MNHLPIYRLRSPVAWKLTNTFNIFQLKKVKSSKICDGVISTISSRRSIAASGSWRRSKFQEFLSLKNFCRWVQFKITKTDFILISPHFCSLLNLQDFLFKVHVQEFTRWTLREKDRRLPKMVQRPSLRPHRRNEWLPNLRVHPYHPNRFILRKIPMPSKLWWITQMTNSREAEAYLPRPHRSNWKIEPCLLPIYWDHPVVKRKKMQQAY